MKSFAIATIARVITSTVVLSLAAGSAQAAHSTHLPRTSKHSRSSRKSASSSFDPSSVNDPVASSSHVLVKGSRGSAVLRAQILLDRAHFPVGEIDGSHGGNSLKAVAAFQTARGLVSSGKVDRATWKALNADSEPAVVSYTLTETDLSGPFTKIPAEAEEKAALKSLEFENPLESLGERFHASPKLLTALNRGKSVESAKAKAGETIFVPATTRPALAKASRVVVSQGDLSVSALGPDGTVLARYPASTGSEHDPLPLGDWKILGVARHPVFHYDPNLFWDAEDGKTKLTFAAGPNNPVGVVWIDLSKPHYGIHGSPEPQLIGKTQSHGCIRLTNWDAAELSQLVGPGTPATLKD